MGLLLTDLRADFATTRLRTLDADALEPIERAFADLRTQAEAWFQAEHIDPAAQHLSRTVDMRYAGQNYELAVPVPPGPITAETLSALAAGFAEAHQRMYGFLAEEEPVQLVTFRAEATGVVPKATLQAQDEVGADASGARTGSRKVWLPEAGGWTECPVYDRDKLQPGNRIEGAAIIEQMDTTTVVLPGMAACADTYLNLVLQEGTDINRR